MNEINKYSKGSEWRKWDLHFHTPSSYDYGDKSVTNEEIIDELANNDISVVAITDHHIIDIERIKTLQEIGAKKAITVLPGIEFLSDAKGRQPVHFIGIFPENCNLEFVWGQIQNRTAIKDINGAGKKINEVYCNLSDTIKLVKELGGIVSIHAGQKSNTVENITHSLPHGEAQKTDIAFEVDIYELGKEEDQKGYREIVFPTIKKILPMIICSDNHNIKKYVLKQNCWIKADPSFEGLKQIIYEPELRVHIGELPPNEKSPKLKIDSINISDSDNFPIQNQEVNLNGDLTCIIGGRGSGKSSLLETLAYCYGKNKTNTESFIQHFLKKGANANIEIKYLDLEGNTLPDSKVELSKENSEFHVNPILYLGQNKIEEIANNKNEIHELAFGTVKRSSDLSNDIIEIQKEIESTELELVAANKEIEADRIQLGMYDAEKLTKEKEGILSELKLLESEETTVILKELSESRKEKDALEKIYESNKVINDAISRLKENLEPQINTINQQFIELGNETTIILDYDAITKSLTEQIKTLPKENIDKKYQTILVQAKEQLAGKTDVSVSYIESLKSRINDIDKSLKLDIQNKEILAQDVKMRYELLQQLDDDYKELEEIYSEAIMEFAKLNYGVLKQVQLEASHELELEKFINVLFEQVDKRKIKKLHLFINDYFKKYQGDEFDFIDWVKAFESDPENYNIFYGDGVKVFEDIAYNNHNILNTKIYYEIAKDHSKPLSQLSLGQKGTVILKLYLSTGNNCPIIIDQPEDHLDNDFIYSDLVGTLREAKQKRQIIIVTHDANLVVNGDAEQVIVAKYEDGKITYPLRGSLEHPEIRKKVAKILEGGDIAFKKRERKYNIKEAINL